MKRISLILAVAALASCELLNKPVTESPKVNPASLKVSSAVIEIPNSLSGTGGSLGALGLSRNQASDALVTLAVTSYYRYARDQVEIGSQVAVFLKNLIQGLEGIIVEGKPLIGQDFSWDGVTQQPDNQEPVKWTSLGNNSYALEMYRRSTEGADKTAHLSLNYRLEGDKTQVSGYMTVNTAHLDWDPAPEGEKHPDWIKASFDSSKNGKSWMKLEVEGYRSFADLGDAVQNTLLEVTRDAEGKVSVTSGSLVPNSRHFVWNGYLDGASGEVFNPDAAGETRYYLYRGTADADNKSTVSLAMAPETYEDSSVFTQYSIGKVLAQLFRDRLVKNYQFNSENPESGGHKIVDILNLIDLSDKAADNPLSYAPGSESTPDQVVAALEGVQTTEYYKNSLEAGSKTVIEYLADVMQVSNPAYFEGLIYQTYGAQAPEGYISPAEVEEIPLVEKTAVRDMNLGF